MSTSPNLFFCRVLHSHAEVAVAGKTIGNSDETSTRGIDYKPLNSSKDEIRLIRLLPASPGEPIRCSLFKTPRASAPQYKALSYAWGIVSASHPIIVDSCLFFGTRNLRSGLLSIRPKPGEPELVLWVDAICINQNDIKERNLQTSKMQSIYKNASSVLVFLGTGNNGSSEAIKFAKDLLATKQSQIATLLREESGTVQLQKLVNLFRRKYFWRIWVIQEIHYAKTAMVYCGGEKISWSALSSVGGILAQQKAQLWSMLYRSPSSIHTLLRGGPRSLQLSRFSHCPSSLPPLLELLLSHKSKLSTDPRDKVYALVGISSSKNNFGDINYSRSIRETYIHTARHIISTSKKLDIICVKSHSSNDYSLPSWVPDWTKPAFKPDEKNLSTILGLQHCDSKFAAARNSNARIEFPQSGDVLKAAGVIVSKISKVTNSFRQHRPIGPTTPGLEAVHNWWSIFTANRGVSTFARQEFSRVISCGTWKAASSERKLVALLSLSEAHLCTETNWEKETKEWDSTKKGLQALASATLFMNGRRLFISESKTVGLAPWDSKEGDIICVLLGCRFPVVLRREAEKYILIGEAFIDGFMFGEALAGDNTSFETFEIH